MKALKKRKGATLILLCLLAMGLTLAGCSGGGGEGVSSQVVNGVAAVGAPLAGEAHIKDSSTPAREKTTVIASDGSFAFDVTDMKGPFILRARGSADGENHTLQSFADNPGTANINPLANAAVAHAAGVDDPSEVYERPDRDRLDKIKSDLPASISEILEKLKPLLRKFNADDRDPVRGHYQADHNHLDGLFDNVKITLSHGILTIINKKTGAVIFTGKISDIKNGHLDDDDDNLPNPGPVPTAPAAVTAAGGDGQVTISWTAIGNATSYNIYWSTTTGVTKATGTKIAGAANPYVQSGLTSGTTYYYIVTAVNSAGESDASAQGSATTNAAPPVPTVPAAPAGVIATGGTNQATLSWSAVSGATSYNVYWSTATGVTKASGTKIAGVTSPTVLNGLADSTTYYYIVTAANSVGEGAASVQVAATTLTPIPAPTAPASPTGVTAAGGANRATISWSAVSGAAAYNIYWSTTPGVTTATGTRIAGVTSPYVQTGLSAGTAYHYIVTAVNSVGESAPSASASATTNPPPPAVPAAPAGLTATGGDRQVTVSWSAASGATSYNIYWSTTPGVTTGNGTKITGATSPYLQTGLAAGASYYYIVTAANVSDESPASAQATATTNAPLPAIPAVVTAIGGANQVTVSWTAVSGATSYNLYWSTVSGVTTGNGTRIAGVTSSYVHTGLAAGAAYYYIVTAVNSTGEGPASAQTTAAATIPAIPTGVTATGGAKQATISWSAVSGAASYNLYWSTASGVTTGTGTRITGATRPYLHAGLADGTAYYYIVTALNSAGESAASVQVTATTNAAPPPALDGVALYVANCQRCHGSLAGTDIVGRTLESFKSASMTRGLADDALLAIIAVLP